MEKITNAKREAVFLIPVVVDYFFQAFITSPIYMEWMPAGKLAYRNST